MKYIRNDYGKNFKVKFNNSSLFMISNFSIYQINREFKKINNLSKTYSFYIKIFKILKTKYNFELINQKSINSHLFAVKFDNIKSSQLVFEIFKKCGLPVVTWPEKKYINTLPHNLKNKSKMVVDKMIFLCSFYNNFYFEYNQKLILKKIKLLNENT